MFGVGRTDIGNVRTNNEDYIFVSNERVGNLPNLFIVADGMGGYSGGEVASRTAVDSAVESIRTGSDSDILDALVESVKFANKTVYDMAKSSEELSQMGTTYSAAVVWENKLFAVHVGDSRIYVVSNNQIKQVTCDHTYVMEMVRTGQMSAEEAESSPQKNVITRAVGVNDVIEVDGIVSEIKYGDYILICSDGLNSMLNDNELLEIFNRYHNPLDDLVNDLIYHANKNGGKDNISVIVIQY